VHFLNHFVSSFFVSVLCFCNIAVFLVRFLLNLFSPAHLPSFFFSFRILDHLQWMMYSRLYYSNASANMKEWIIILELPLIFNTNRFTSPGMTMVREQNTVKFKDGHVIFTENVNFSPFREHFS